MNEIVTEMKKLEDDESAHESQKGKEMIQAGVIDWLIGAKIGCNVNTTNSLFSAFAC